MTRNLDHESVDSVVGDADFPVFKTQHDWESSSDISATIIEAVSVALGRDPTDIHPLYDVVDPDALDQLLLSFRSNGPHDEGTASVKFIFNSCEVRVKSNGDIWLERLDIRQ